MFTITLIIVLGLSSATILINLYKALSIVSPRLATIKVYAKPMQRHL